MSLTMEERFALRKLSKNDSKIVLPADKGNATVVMKKEDYKNKMTKMLNEGPCKVIRNPTSRTPHIFIFRNLSEEYKRHLINSDPRPPIIYGLPKVHKDGIPMLPIVSSIGSPTYNIAKFVSKHLSEFVGLTESFVKDSRHFIEIIKRVKLDDNDILVSFDVESLFTSIPVPETVDIIRTLLDDSLAQLAEICLNSTYFYFDGKYFEQTEGAAMGSPLSPVAANLFMEHLERNAMESAILKPKIWLRYVDDVWAVWPHGRNKLTEFLDHLNSINSNIKFTMEEERDRKLPFLDVLTTRKENGTIGHAVYRKPTHTNRYLNAQSHHHPAQKNGILNTLINRAIRISDMENRISEEKVITSALLSNGYSKKDIKRAFKRQDCRLAQVAATDKQKVSDNSERRHNSYLPYVKGTSEKIGRILKKYDITPVYRPLRKINSLLPNGKDKLPLSAPGVYKIPCSCGKVYIGETKRMISTRLKEHIRQTKQENIEKLAVAEHSFTTKHAIEFDKVKVLAKEPYFYHRKIREAIEIKKHPDNFNKDDSYKLPQSWNPVLRHLVY
ncbi:uncharacterized protein LOC129005267 [Macrosteles quadrilineatus]|uniref:uncharacterized protein LOC129005267 n=1 Tax=Macrosteles quadrilineatus TaxID=74068 RepID=UPI0023E0B476|nr:uncharacterized protein LOC129005267 [Macrosteles quadrilineatus]